LLTASTAAAAAAAVSEAAAEVAVAEAVGAQCGCLGEGRPGDRNGGESKHGRRAPDVDDDVDDDDDVNVDVDAKSSADGCDRSSAVCAEAPSFA
jgi:hypothetical protein